MPNVNVKDCGARGDGFTDDTAAIQYAMNLVTGQFPASTANLSASYSGGGTLFFPPGSYIVSGPLVVNGNDLWIRGVGKRNVQLPAWVTLANNPATAASAPSTLYLTTASAGFVLPNSNFCNGFRVSSITLQGPALPALASPPPLAAAPPYPQSAFLFELTGLPQAEFSRDFVFEDMTVSGCQVAFNLVGSPDDGSEGAAGVIRIVRCSIQNNQWIALTGADLHWNGFTYVQNDSGHNGFSGNAGGINIAGENISICDNVMETTQNAVCVYGYQSVVVRNNYFEANTGDYVICINGSEGPWVVGPNNLNPPDAGIPPATHNVLIQSSARGVCHDPAWLQGSINVQTPDPGTSFSNNDVPLVLNNGSTDPYYCVDTAFAPFARRPAGIVAGPVFVSESNGVGVSPFDGSPMAVMAGSTDGGSSVPFPAATLDIPVNPQSPPTLWLGASVAMQRGTSAQNNQPALTLTVDGATILAPAGGTATPSGSPLTLTFAGTSTGVYENVVQAGDWALFTFAVPIQGPNTVTGTQPITATVGALPYGGGAPAGLQYQVRPPILYVVGNINQVRPYFDPYQARVASAPGEGRWSLGTPLEVFDPRAAGYGDAVRVDQGAPPEAAPVEP